MNVGDIQKHQINGIVVDYIATQADVDEYNTQVAEQEKQDKIAELRRLRVKISFKDESDIMIDNMNSTYTDAKDIIARIRQLQEGIGVENLPDDIRPAICYDCDSNKDTTREDLIEMIGKLSKEVYILKGGTE